MLYGKVQRQNRMMRALSRVSQELSSILAVDELLRRIAETMRKLISFDAFTSAGG